MSYGTINADVIGTSVAGSNIGAGNASIMKNRIINGAMLVNQRATAVTATGYTVDRWQYEASQASKATVAQNTSVYPVGFTSSLQVTSSSAYTVGSSEFFTIEQFIEGLNCTDLVWGTANAKTVTLSAWVYSSLTGTFGGCVANYNLNYSYPFTYSIPVANTWTQISITIAGPTSGTWATTNTGCIFVQFSLGAGSAQSGTAGSWSANGYRSATGGVSVVGTNGATFYITGVQLEVGSSATGFEYVNYQTSLANCQRYYSRLNSATSNAYTAFGSAAWNTSTSINGYLKYPTTMRSSPTITYGGTVGVSYSGGNTTNITGVGSTYCGSDSALWQPTGLTGATTGQGGIILAVNDATAYIAFSAEL